MITHFRDSPQRNNTTHSIYLEKTTCAQSHILMHSQMRGKDEKKISEQIMVMMELEGKKS